MIIIFEKSYSWNKIATLLVIDQPFGTGFSWSNSSNIIDNTDLASQYLLKFLHQFFDEYSKLKKNPFYIFGVSYAGHYIPAFAKDILNDNLLAFINYQGIGIAGAWVNPLLQVNNILPYLFINCRFLIVVNIFFHLAWLMSMEENLFNN